MSQPGLAPLPEPAARDPRALTAAERAATGGWTAEPAPALPEEAVSVAIEREGEPALLFAAADSYGGGSVHVGHWPDGVEWEMLLRATGVPNSYGLRETAARSRADR